MNTMPTTRSLAESALQHEGTHDYFPHAYQEQYEDCLWDLEACMPAALARYLDEHPTDWYDDDDGWYCTIDHDELHRVLLDVAGIAQ